MNPRLLVHVPDADEPGYLRRARRALELKDQLEAGTMTAAVVDELVSFLSSYVAIEGSDGDPKEVLYDLSENQFKKVLDEVAGQEGKQEVPPASGGDSSEPTKE